MALFRAAAGAGLVGFALLGLAIATASIRFQQCGPSRLHAVEPACRTGAKLLLGAYGLLSIALVLGAVSLTLLWRARRERRH